MSLTYETLLKSTNNLIDDNRYHQLIMWGGGYGKPGWKDGDPIDMDYIKQTQQQWLEFLATIKTSSSNNEPSPSH